LVIGVGDRALVIGTAVVRPSPTPPRSPPGPA
jgi:hypothetical protein